MYEQVINCVSQIYTKMGDSDVKQCCISCFKQFLIILGTGRPNKPLTLPFKLDFILKIHQLSPFTDRELESILRYPLVQRSSVQEVVHTFFQSDAKGLQFAKCIFRALNYAKQNNSFRQRQRSLNDMSADSYCIPDSILYLYSFHPALAPLVSSLKQFNVFCINQNWI